MTKRTLQIDITGELKDISMMECKLVFDGRSCLIYMPKAHYEALKYDGLFIRDGNEVDSANVLNTTNVFEERI